MERPFHSRHLHARQSGHRRQRHRDHDDDHLQHAEARQPGRPEHGNHPRGHLLERPRRHQRPGRKPALQTQDRICAEERYGRLARSRPHARHDARLHRGGRASFRGRPGRRARHHAARHLDDSGDHPGRVGGPGETIELRARPPLRRRPESRSEPDPRRPRVRDSARDARSRRRDWRRTAGSRWRLRQRGIRHGRGLSRHGQRRHHARPRHFRAGWDGGFR